MAAVGADEERRQEDNMEEILKTWMQKRQCIAVMQHEQDFSSKRSLAQMVAGVMSDDKNLQFEMTKGLRKLLSIKPNPPINEVVKSGVVPRFVQFLSRDDFPQLQLEAAWALTNVASGTSENTKVIIDSGAVPLFIKLLCSPNEHVRKQAIWALGNVAVDSPQRCDFVLSHGAMFYVLLQCHNYANPSMLRTATWTLSNFCSSPQLAVDQTFQALLVLHRLLHSTDEQILIYACLALSYLSDSMKDKVQTVIDSGVIPRLIQLLAHPSPSVIIPALRTIYNITKVDDEMQTTVDELQIQTLLNYHLLPGLLNLLTNTSKESIKQTFAGLFQTSQLGIQEVIQSGIIPPLIHLLQQGQLDIKKDAAWAITNAIAGGNHDQIKFLVSQGCIKPLCDLLTCSDLTVVTMCLKGLEKILKEKNVGNLYETYDNTVKIFEAVRCCSIKFTSL